MAVLPEHVKKLVDVMLDFEPEDDQQGFIKTMKEACNGVLINCCLAINDCFRDNGRKLFIEGNLKEIFALLCSPSQIMMVNAVAVPKVMKHIDEVWAAHLEGPKA